MPESYKRFRISPEAVDLALIDIKGNQSPFIEAEQAFIQGSNEELGRFLAIQAAFLPLEFAQFVTASLWTHRIVRAQCDLEQRSMPPVDKMLTAPSIAMTAKRARGEERKKYGYIQGGWESVEKEQPFLTRAIARLSCRADPDYGTKFGANVVYFIMMRAMREEEARVKEKSVDERGR